MLREDGIGLGDGAAVNAQPMATGPAEFCVRGFRARLRVVAVALVFNEESDGDHDGPESRLCT
ncbi:hypothetical protein GCM10010371_53100 [Streptomyces subrutilus]|uniref:Uncharacterized protein n=1 Tax=Streptomyces subrutilus TaxID=36818 RepID=A0A5P2UF55_9ACTN|nr:hypothetical protein CP968_01120 [Streptomyces subrutilus]GGZ86519.1 hypothetical protein GCM10010371_53100 [Streptomyces subrutilus]